MIIARLIGITGAAGLTLGLCRRARSLFWKAIGFLCLLTISRSTQQGRGGRPLKFCVETAQARVSTLS